MNCAKIPELHSQVGTFPQISSPATRILLLTLVFLIPNALWANVPPVVDNLTADPLTVTPDGVVSLTVNASDPDCSGSCTSGCGMVINPVQTNWSAPAGTFSNENDGVASSPYIATADWTAPSTEGTYTIQVHLGDNGGFACGGLKETTATIDIQVTLIVTDPPIVDVLTAERSQLFPGEATELSCSAHDPEGDPVTYSWSTDAGSVAPGAGGTATFTAGDPGVATVICTAADSFGVEGSASIQVSSTDAVAERRLKGGLRDPQGLAVSASGKVYVIDPAAGGLAVLDLETGNRMGHIAQAGAIAVAVDWNGDLVVGLRDGARVLSPSGALIRELESGQGLVSAVAADPIRQRYAVAHRDTGRVTIFDAAGGFFAGFGKSGDAPAELKQPSGVAFTPGGNVVVADGGHGQVKVFTTAGTLLNAFGGLGGAAGEFVRLAGLTVDENGIIFVCDVYQHRVVSWNPAGTLREVFGSYGDDLGQLKAPSGVAVTDGLYRLVVASTAGSRIEVFKLKEPGLLPAPDAQLSTITLAFGNQAVGVASTARTVTLSNNGNANLTLQSAVADGDFSVTHACPGSIAPGSSCILSLGFTPATTGTRSGSLTVATSDGVRGVGLTGYGILPATASLDRVAMDFGRWAVGTMSASQSVTVTNYGTEGLAISGIQTPADFALVTSCGTFLPGGSSCLVDVYFNPASSGNPIYGSLVVYSSAGIQVVSLAGAAYRLEALPDREALTFASTSVGTTSAPQAIAVTNTGDEPVAIGGLSISGADAGEFILASDDCSGVVLAVAGACTFQVAYAPSVEDPATAQVAIVSNAPSTPVVSLASAGAETPFFYDGFESGDVSQWSNSVGDVKSVAVGEMLTGTSEVRILSWRNRLARPIRLDFLTLEGEGADQVLVEEDGCSGMVLQPGELCELHLTLAPWRSGPIELDVHLPSDAKGALVPSKTKVSGRAVVEKTATMED